MMVNGFLLFASHARFLLYDLLMFKILATFASNMNDFTTELAKLHQLTGAEFSRQVERIALRKEFHPLETAPEIFTVGGEKSDELL